MNNKTDWLTVLLSLGFGLFLLFSGQILLNITNPKVEQKCAEKGGQVLVRPGHVSACLYPAK